ncbi:MAG: hypothetical protein EXQ58_04065 [Acidobacteria bacterium]|nr:hypothetical protein [Acidobacteriota bacterium]
MEQEGRFESLKDRDNQALTLRLFESISSFHSVPRLRQKLAKIVFADFEAHVPHAMERDVAYLVSGLNELLGMVLDPHEYPDLPRELGEYLRHCDSNGLAIHHFLSRSAKPWDEIRSKYQELSRVELTQGLCRQFPALSAETADRHSGYLLSRALARLVPPFSFHEEPEVRFVIVIRAQADLPWNLCADPLDALTTLQTHFPGIGWKGDFQAQKLWFVGVRLLSQFSPKTAFVLKSALDQLSHISTSLAQKRRRTLHLAFFSEADANVFKFNLHHYATMAGAFCETFATDLVEFRSGYPGLTGFVEQEIRHEMGR